MTVSRRLVLRTIPLAAILGAVAACSGGTGGASSSAGATAALTPTNTSLALNTAAWSHDADADVYYQIGLSYAATPQDAGYETLSIFVPGAYVSATDNGDGTFALAPAPSGAAGDYTGATAPFVLPVNTPGYSAQKPLTEYSSDTVAPYMKAGLIYVHAGLRGKDSTTESAAGNAPWGVTDLKAAVRFLRYNAASLPGDAEQVYVFGHSGGGAQSAVMGASGDSDLYTPYLTALGAATTSPDGAALSDAVAGAMCWCPITSLNEANAAYEWNMGQFSSTGTRAPGTWTGAHSKDLAAAYATWVNGVGLVDGDGRALTLEESSDGVYLAGSYYDHVVGVIEQSLNDFLAATTFPYTPSSTQMAGMEPGGGSGGAPSGGAPSGGGAPGGTPPTGAPGGGTAPSGGGPSEGGTSSGGAPSGGPSGGGASDSTTYATVEDYIASLNASAEWVSYDATTNRAAITGLAGFVASQKSASKDVGALDGVDRGQTENTVLGAGGTALHFSQVSRDAVVAGESAYAALSGWSSDCGSAGYDSDFAQADSVGTDVLIREKMYNPHDLPAGRRPGRGLLDGRPRLAHPHRHPAGGHGEHGGDQPRAGAADGREGRGLRDRVGAGPHHGRADRQRRGQFHLLGEDGRVAVARWRTGAGSTRGGGRRRRAPCRRRGVHRACRPVTAGAPSSDPALNPGGPGASRRG